MSGELISLPALEFGQRIRAREVSAEDACRAHLDRAEATESAIGADLDLEPEAALGRARAIDGLERAGGERVEIELPCGLGDDGLPCGVQLTAARWREAELLRFAQRLETERGFDTCGASAA